MQLEAKEGKLSTKPQGSYLDTHPLRKVTAMGVKEASSVAFNGRKLEDGWDFDGDAGVLTVDMRPLTLGGAWGAEWTLEWK